MGWLTALREEVYPVAGRDGFLDRFEEAAGFTPARAACLAWAAQLAYETRDGAKLERILAGWGWRPAGLLRGHFASDLPLVNTRGFAAEAGDATVIAFAGTEPTDLFNWFTNIAIDLTASGAHKGFHAAVDAVWPGLRDIAARPGRGLYLAGHSLGGALAAIAAKRLLEEGVLEPERLRGVCTIGMPRTGNARHAEAYAACADGLLQRRTWRLVHGDDIVPQVPPTEAPFGFRHVGDLLACPHGGRFEGTPAPAADLATNGGILEVARGLQARFLAATEVASDLPGYPGEHPLAPPLAATLPRAIRDHLTDRYLRALGAMRG